VASGVGHAGGAARGILKGAVPFQTLSADALDALARAAEEGEASPDQTIYDASGPASHLYIVRSGTIRLERPEDPTRPPRVVGPREVFGGQTIQGTRTGPERAIAASAASLIRVHGRSVLEALAREPNGGKAAVEALREALGGGPAPLVVAEGPRKTAPPRVAARFLRSAASALGTHLRSPRTYLRLLGYALFFGAWYLAVEVLALPRFAKLPGITQVIHEWLSRDPVFGLSLYTPVYYEHIWASLRRIAIAFTLATTLGVPVGLALGASTTFRQYVFPVFELLRPIPILAWVPLAIIVFSGSETPVVFLTFLASFFATALNTLHGVKSVDPRYVLAARCLGASRWQAFWHVIVPGSLPSILTGLQISIGVAWFSLAAAEMVSGQFGLGYLINTAYTMVQYPTIVIGMLTLGFVGYSTSAAVRFVGNRLMVWRARELALEKA
jgi:ABC-type nitrate/sulfonate/bicarbonate transport system permease component